MNKPITSTDKQLLLMQFANRERSFSHTPYDDEMEQYVMLRNGDERALDLGVYHFNIAVNGHLSKDPLQHMKFMFVASTTLATRFCIEGGLNAETAYSISDLFILKADECRTIDELNILHDEMFRYFLQAVKQVREIPRYSRPVLQAIHYIEAHLHEIILIDELAEEVSLSPSYFSALFIRETGLSASDYIRRKRIETAENMLIHSDYSISEISEFLAFSTDSHFIKVFRQINGITPRHFRKLHTQAAFEKGRDPGLSPVSEK